MWINLKVQPEVFLFPKGDKEMMTGKPVYQCKPVYRCKT